MDMFSKGQLSLKSTQIFLYHPYAEARDKNAPFFHFTKEEYTQMMPWGSTKLQCIIKYLPTLYLVTSKELTTQDSEAQPLLCSVEGTLEHPPGQLLLHCRATAPECCGPQAYFLMSVLLAVPCSQINL